jgi:hypothetical protein
MACAAVDYQDTDVRARLEVRYPPENSPLIKALLEAAMSAVRNDLDGSKRATSKAVSAAADEAVKRQSATGRYLRTLAQTVSGGRHGALFGLHVATTDVKAQLGLSGDPSKSLLWLTPIAARRRPAIFDLVGTRRKPLSAVASDLAILLRDPLDLTIRLRGTRTTLTKAERQRLEDWAIAHCRLRLRPCSMVPCPSTAGWRRSRVDCSRQWRVVGGGRAHFVNTWRGRPSTASDERSMVRPGP